MDVLEGQGCSFHNQGASKPWRQSLRGQQRILKGGAFVDVPEESHSERQNRIGGQNRIRRVKVGPGRVMPEGQNRGRVAFGASKSYRRVKIESVKSKSDLGGSCRRVKSVSGSHPEGQSASGEPFRRVKIASGSSKSCPGGSFGGSKWYPGGSKAYP